MSLEIYPADFSTRYEISHVFAVSMTVHYNEIGKIQLNVFSDDYNISALKVGNIIFDTDRQTTYIITETKCDTSTNLLTANGFTTEWLLNNRCIAQEKSIVNIESGCYELITENLRDFPRITLAPLKGLPEEYQGDDETTKDVDESVVHGGQLLDEIQKVLEYGELGRKMNWDWHKLEWQFEIYKGNDLTQGIHKVAFVEEQGTCSDLIITTDDSNFKNVAYVEWTYNDDKKIEVIGEATGGDRHEIWIKSSISKQNKDTEAQTRKRVIDDGMKKLAEYISRRTFKISIDSAELGTRFNIGDVVTCVSNRFGVTFDARITGVKYTLDATGENTEIILGDPILTALGELKLHGNN